MSENDEVREFTVTDPDDNAVTLRARQVTEDDGEDVNTTGGPVHAAKGSYLLERDKPGVYDVYDENQWNEAYGDATENKSDTSKSAPRDDTAKGSDIADTNKDEGAPNAPARSSATRTTTRR